MARGKAWDFETKMQAAMAYVLTGYLDQASKICNVPQRTLSDWVRSDWFQKLIEEARDQKQDELDGIWTNIIHSSAEKVLQRVHQGDPVIDKKTGEVTYIPVKAKDLAVITAILADKRALLRGQATTRVEKVSVEKHLDDVQKVLEGGLILDEESKTEKVE